MDNLDKGIGREDYPEMKKELMSRLSEIEKKYSDWFSQRVDKRTGEKPDRLENYYTFSLNPPRSYFGCGRFGLPKHFSNECLDAYLEIFDSNQMQVFRNIGDGN